MLKVKFENNEELLKVFKSIENILNINNQAKFVYFVNQENKLKIIANGDTMQIHYLMEVSEIDGNSAAYDYKKLNSLLNVISGQVAIEDGNIKGKKCSYKIPCENIEPCNFEELKDFEYCCLNTQEFKNALEKTSIATDKKTSGIMSGVYIGENKLIACDSKRVAIESIKTSENIIDVTMPRDFIKEVLKLPFKDKIQIGVSKRRLIIQDEALKIATFHLAEKYPQVEKILPKEKLNTVVIKNNELNEALTMVMPVLDEISKACCLEYKKNSMRISVENGNQSAETNINIQSNVQENIKIKFNLQLLLDMLKANDEEIVITTYKDGIGYKFLSKDDCFQYIMPIIN